MSLSEQIISEQTFTELGIHSKIAQALGEHGYTIPTPVQAAAIPPALAGRDILATAETGTGKTAAFMLPALTRVAELPASGIAAPRILVLAPTRELASQVTQAARKYAKPLRMNIIDVVGGSKHPLSAAVRLLSPARV